MEDTPLPVGDPTTPGVRTLRVLAWPLQSGRDGNPFVDLLYARIGLDPAVELTDYTRRRLAQERWDVVHIHWPEWAIRRTAAQAWIDTVRFVTLIELARLRGARIVWTAHNLRPHEASPAVDRFMRVFVHQVDLVIGLSAASLTEAERVYPALRRAKKVVIPHGHYRATFASPSVSRADARRRLGLSHSGRTLLLLGQLRPYKNVDGLIRCFRAVASPDDRLVIAGRPLSEDFEQTILDAAESDGRLLLRLTHVPDTEVPYFVRAADLVVLPYHTVANSGTALLALSFDRPVLTPATGSFPEIATTVGSDWVQMYSGEFDERVLRLALDLPLPEGQPDLNGLEWDVLSERTLAEYRSSVSRHRALLRPFRRSRSVRAR